MDLSSQIRRVVTDCSPFRWPSHPEDLSHPLSLWALPVLIDESLNEEFLMLIIQLMPYGIDNLFMLFCKPLDILQVLPTLTVIE
jgi:hypothetical protein